MKHLLSDDGDGTFPDAKKTDSNTEDDLMCWAAAASNVLAWTEWGLPPDQGFTDEDSIFQHFQKHWPDGAGHLIDAWKWWFTDKEELSEANVPEGGGFWSSSGYRFEDYYHVETDRTKALTAIADSVDKGYGVALDLLGRPGGHTITCWGYEQDEEGKYLGIYTTDSDDTRQGLQYYPVDQDTDSQEWAGYKDWWYFTYYRDSTRFLIGDVHALDQCPRPSAPTNLTVELMQD
jgi:hypothetical protein